MPDNPIQILSDPPDLATLRALCGQPIPSDASPNEEKPTPYYYLRPTRLRLRTEIIDVRPREEIAKEVDNRPLLQLLAERDAVMKQITIRAAAGDEHAIRLLLSSARGVIAALGTVERTQPEKLQSIAETATDWPVLLSPNPKDIDDARNCVARLNVGAKSAIPRRRGQKVDPRGFWTRLATAAFQACQDNKVFVLALKAHCAGIQPKREAAGFWGITMEASYYYVSSTDCIVIADWEEQCVNLSPTVTKDTLKQWWHVVKHHVLEYWGCFPQEYAEALRSIGHAEEEEWWRRNKAVDRLEQAFRDLFGLRQLR